MASDRTDKSRSRRRSGAGASEKPPSPEREAARHRHTRQAHTTELAEDYVEIVSDLIATNGEARVVDIARRLGVTQVTVTRTIARLQRDGFVSSQPYRAIFLTERGRDLAELCRHRHEVVYQFLLSIGVPAPAAERDAEGIEHHVGEETLAAFEKHLRAARKPAGRK